MPWIQANGDYEKNHLGEIIRAAVEDLRRDGCTTFSIFGLCWGALMAVKAASEEGTPFLSAGGPHPSFVTVEAVKDVKAPLVLLPSKDEPDMVSTGVGAKRVVSQAIEGLIPDSSGPPHLR
jgi:dienelactone hydrolase